jgi:hypothetical protein
MTAPQFHGPETWARAEADYRAGLTAPEVCARHGVGESALRKRAQREGWRRADQGEPPPPPPIDDTAPLRSAAEVADMIWRRATEAVRLGRSLEAQRWAAMYDDWDKHVAHERYRARMAAAAAAADAAASPAAAPAEPSFMDRIRALAGAAAVHADDQDVFDDDDEDEEDEEEDDGPDLGYADNPFHHLGFAAPAPPPVHPVHPIHPVPAVSTPTPPDPADDPDRAHGAGAPRRRRDERAALRRPDGRTARS